MQVQVNTDHNIEGRESLAEKVRDIVESALSRVSSQITRVEVHLSDESSNKTSPNDQRCVMEARIEHHQPIAVTHQAATLNQAIDGAIDKLARLIESTIGKLHDKQGRIPEPNQPDSTNE